MCVIQAKLPKYCYRSSTEQKGFVRAFSTLMPSQTRVTMQEGTDETRIGQLKIEDADVKDDVKMACICTI